jgi:hypothetical protein
MPVAYYTFAISLGWEAARSFEFQNENPIQAKEDWMGRFAERLDWDADHWAAR